jgi:hypothetical protein
VTGEYRYAGPDGERIADLPAGVGAAIGSEYCVHLLPGTEKLAAAIAVTRERRVPLLLLTSYFRDDELKRAMPLLRSIPAGVDVDVAVNDWGLLFTVHTLFPRLRLSLGRLLSGQKRCPRIGSSPHLTEEGRAWHGEGIFSSAAARDFIAREFGVSGYHVDSLEWGSSALEKIPADGPSGGTRLYVHEPFAAVTVSDRCPWIGGKSSSSVDSCRRDCRDGAVILHEPSMGGEMIQRGKARFVRRGPSGLAARDAEAARNRVVYDDPP